MDIFIAEGTFGNRNDLSRSIKEYNAKAAQFLSGLNQIKAKYVATLLEHNLKLGVETVDNIENCTIGLKPLPVNLPDDIKNELMALFNTTWSR